MRNAMNMSRTILYGHAEGQCEPMSTHMPPLTVTRRTKMWHDFGPAFFFLSSDML